jgi:hypothetical protein
MKKEYTPIHLDYENFNNLNYQPDESILSIISNKNQPEMIISEFTNNKNKYLLFESIINQVSHAPNLTLNKIELITYEKIINRSEFTAWKYTI